MRLITKFKEFFQRGPFKPPLLEGYVFIVTYGRTGSTLLQTILQSIDGYTIRGENMNALYGLFLSHKAIKEAQQVMRKGQIPKHGPWYGMDKVHSKVFGNRLVKVFRKTILQPEKNTRVLGFKEIRFNQAADDFPAYLNFIQTFFHPAKFIFLTRDAAQVSQSRWWADMDEKLVFEMIEDCNTKFLAYQKNHPKTCFAIDYSDFNNNAEGLKGLFAFLEEPYHPDRIQPLLDHRLPH